MWRIAFSFLLFAWSVSVLSVTSMVNIQMILLDPARFEGESVSIVGYMNRYSESQYVIFFSEFHSKVNDFGNAVLVQDKWSADGDDSLVDCGEGYVRVDGFVRQLNSDIWTISDIVSAEKISENEDGDIRIENCSMR